MNNENTVKKLVEFTAEQKKACLFIVNDEFSKHKLSNELQKLGLVKSQTWQEILSNLEQGLSNYFELKESHLPQAKTIYDLLVQFNERGGMIQLMDKATMKLESAQFVQGEISLVIIASDLVLQEFEKIMPFIDKFGMVERVGEI